MLEHWSLPVKGRTLVKFWRPVYEKIDAKVPKNAKLANFQTPYLTQMGPISTEQKRFFSGPEGYNMYRSDRGSGTPKWVFPKSDPPQLWGALAPLFTGGYVANSKIRSGDLLWARRRYKAKIWRRDFENGLGSEISASISPKTFSGKGGGSALVRNCAQPQGFPTAPARKFGVTPLHFLRPFSFSQKFYTTLGTVAPVYRGLSRIPYSKFSSGHPIFVGKR